MMIMIMIIMIMIIMIMMMIIIIMTKTTHNNGLSMPFLICTVFLLKFFFLLMHITQLVYVA